MNNGIINIFINTVSTKPTVITVSLNETIGSAKKKYYNKVGSRKYNQWIYNADVLEDKMTLSEVGIEDKDEIMANESSRGGGGLHMADISNERGLVQGNFSKNARDWHIITTGLNVSGICNNGNCIAYKKSVDCQIGLGTFDLVRDADKIKCPMCKEEMEPTTCCFSKCQYKFEGKKKVEGKTEYVNREWKRVEKDYEYYDPQESGIVRWLMLIIETKPL